MEDARVLERSTGAAGFGDKSHLSVFSAIGRGRTMVSGSWKPLRAMDQCNSQFSPLGSSVGCGLETGQLDFCIRIQMRNSVAWARAVGLGMGTDFRECRG